LDPDLGNIEEFLALQDSAFFCNVTHHISGEANPIVITVFFPDVGLDKGV